MIFEGKGLDYKTKMVDNAAGSMSQAQSGEIDLWPCFKSIQFAPFQNKMTKKIKNKMKRDEMKYGKQFENGGDL